MRPLKIQLPRVGSPFDADEEQQEDSQQELLRIVFQAWRTAAANQHARRVHSNQNEVPLHESEHPASCIVHGAKHPALAPSLQMSAWAAEAVL